MEIRTIHEDQSRLLALLYPGGRPQEDSREHVQQGTLFALYDGEMKIVALVTPEEQETFAIRKMANTGCDEGKCYASRMIMYLVTHYQGHGKKMVVDPRNGSLGNGLFESLGFVRAGWIDPRRRMEEEKRLLEVFSHPL